MVGEYQVGVCFGKRTVNGNNDIHHDWFISKKCPDPLNKCVGGGGGVEGGTGKVEVNVNKTFEFN